MIKSKSIYEIPEEEDGVRILISKEWPEGLSRDEVKLDLWLKEIAPTKDFDEWPDESPSSFTEFKEHYRDELRKKKTLIKNYPRYGKGNRDHNLKLYTTDDPEQNPAAVLRDKLEGYKTLVTSSSSCV